VSSIVTRTLLLTDIVGSTSLVEALGDAPAATLLAQVDREVRDAVAGTRGVEIDKTDGFLILFERAVDAVRCATRIHKALATLSKGVKRPVKMRCGLHSGEIVLRENSPADVARGAKPLEVDGLAKPMAARIMSLAAGGQTLMTRPAHELASRASVGDPELGALRYTAHGTYYLAGVSEAIEVPDLRQGAPSAQQAAHPAVVRRRGAHRPRAGRRVGTGASAARVHHAL
jgi:class 3 adenylate cyclase